MSYSKSNQPDLDWSQVRETVKLLTVSVAQVEDSMKAGDESVNLLAGSFTSMVDHMNAIHDILNTLEAGETRDLALMHCTATQEKINASIMAFQFYDRLQQCLDHISIGLRGLSAIIDNPQRLYNPNEWYQFQSEIRSRYTMESEKALFDAILQGKSIDEAIALVAESSHNDDEDDIELF